MAVVFLVILAAACSVFYLSLPQQKWLQFPLDRKWGRVSAALLSAVALAVAISHFSIGTSIFALLVIAMLVLSLLPFVSLLKIGHSKDRCSNEGQGKAAQRYD